LVDVLLSVAQFTTQVVYAITALKPTVKDNMFGTSHIFLCSMVWLSITKTPRQYLSGLWQST